MNQERQSGDRRKRGDSWQAEAKELISGASGGFLFGIPLLYTMEVWFIGSYVKPPVSLIILSITFIIVLLLNRIEGFRPQESETFPGAIAESFKTLAIGMVCATIMLVILKRIDFQTSLTQALGKIIFEGVPFSLGVAFSRALLSGDAEVDLNRSNSSQSNFSSHKQKIVWRDTLADLVATVIGTLFIAFRFIAFSIAPTDEIQFNT